MLPPGTTFNLSTFTNETPQQLPFTMETADLTENWNYDGEGRYSHTVFAAEIRASRETHRAALQRLTGRRFLFQIETVDGKKYIIGSPKFPATFTWSDSLSGVSRSAFSIRIECRSLHGVLFST